MVTLIHCFSLLFFFHIFLQFKQNKRNYFYFYFSLLFYSYPNIALVVRLILAKRIIKKKKKELLKRKGWPD